MRCLIQALAAVALSAGSLLAQSDEPAATDFGSDLGPALFKLLGALILILVIIYGSVWLMKRFSGARAGGGGNNISVLERHFLAPKQALYLIRVGQRHMLVGGSESGLRHLADLSADDLGQGAKDGARPGEESKFNKVLKQARQTFMPLLRERTAALEERQ